MQLEIHNISRRFVEVSVDEINTGTLDAREVKELALHLIQIASELLEVEYGNC